MEDEPKVSTTRRAQVEGTPDPKKPQFKPLKVYRLSDVVAQEVKWLWYPYIPMEMVTFIEGDPGLGKSFMASAITADVTRGHSFPGQINALPPQNVLIMSAEDDISHTIRPRLEAQGADLDRVFVSDENFTLDAEGLAKLENSVRTFAATIVFLDPIVAYLGGKMDMNKANEVRAIMAPLYSVAKRTGSAVIVIRHLRKSGGGGNAKFAGLGSIDFIASVRSSLQVGMSKGGTRFMRHVKSNLAREGPTLSYDIIDGRFQWTGTFEDVDHEVPSVSKVTLSMKKASEFIFDTLRDGPVPAVEVEEKATKQGISLQVLKRAKKGIAISRKTRDGWLWELADREGMGDS